MSFSNQSSFEQVLFELQCVLLAHQAATSRNSLHLAWIDFDIMAHLQLKGEHIPSQLCATFRLSRSNMSKHLKRLKSYELVEYRQNTADGRSYFVAITPEGHMLIDTVRRGRQALAIRAKEVLSEEEQRQFAQLAVKITTALDDPTLRMI